MNYCTWHIDYALPAKKIDILNHFWFIPGHSCQKWTYGVAMSPQLSSKLLDQRPSFSLFRIFYACKSHSTPLEHKAALRNSANCLLWTTDVCDFHLNKADQSAKEKHNLFFTDQCLQGGNWTV